MPHNYNIVDCLEQAFDADTAFVELHNRRNQISVDSGAILLRS